MINLGRQYSICKTIWVDMFNFKKIFHVPTRLLPLIGSSLRHTSHRCFGQNCSISKQPIGFRQPFILHMYWFDFIHSYASKMSKIAVLHFFLFFARIRENCWCQLATSNVRSNFHDLSSALNSFQWRTRAVLYKVVIIMKIFHLW